MYAYNTQVHHITGTAIFSLTPFCQATGRTTFVTPSALPTDANSRTPSEAPFYGLLSFLYEMYHNAGKRMEAAQQRYEQRSDAQVR